MRQGRTLPAVPSPDPRRRHSPWASSATPRRSRTVPALALLALLAAALTLGACGGSSASAGGSQAELRVFAASSLTDAFTKLGEQYMAAHPDVKVTFDFAGSQDLAAQLQQGAPADVIAMADRKNMDAVARLVETPQTFAANRLQIAVAPGDPLGIRSLSDLGRKDLKVVLAAPEVPAGEYAAQALQKAGVTVKPVSLEDSVKGVITKVSLGEADAGIVYVTDVIAAGGDVAGVAIPPSQNVTAEYPLARVGASERAREAQGFIDLVLSSAGQQVLRDAGFLKTQ